MHNFPQRPNGAIFELPDSAPTLLKTWVGKIRFSSTFVRWFNLVHDAIESQIVVTNNASEYDVVFSLTGKPGTTTYTWFTFRRTVNFAVNFAGSAGTVGANPTAAAVFTIKKNGATVGTISVSTGGVVTFATSGGAFTCVNGDRWTLDPPAVQDATLAGLAVTIAGTRG